MSNVEENNDDNPLKLKTIQLIISLECGGNDTVLTDLGKFFDCNVFMQEDVQESAKSFRKLSVKALIMMKKHISKKKCKKI